MADKPTYEALEREVADLRRKVAELSRNNAPVSDESPQHQESKQRFERMLAVVPDLISIHDTEMNILYSNWQGFGAVDEEKRIFNTKCYRTYRGLDHICPDCRAREVMETGRPLQKEINLPDGRWVDLRVIPLMDDRGATEMFMEWVRDITDRKQAQMDLQAQKKLLEGVLDSIKDVIGVQFPDHTILQYNRAGYDLLGLTWDEVKGRKCYELIGRDTPCKVCATTRSHQSRKLETIEKYIPELKRYFLCTSNPVLDEAGDIKLIIEQLTDLTEKKKMDEKLQQAQKMESIGSLAGGIAHDFNNILFPIVGLSELLMEDLPPDSTEYQNVQEIFAAGKRGSDLVKQILAFSRQSGDQVIPVKIQKVLKEALKLCRSTIPSDIDITTDIRDDCGFVTANPTQLHQIAMNLITNAYHAVEPTSGTISVSLAERRIEKDDAPGFGLEPGPYAVLTVSDTGAGIDPAVVDRIFDPYFTTKKKNKGTGLGLSVVHGIVRGYGGDIRVYSEVDQGTRFDVYLPLREDPPEPTAAETVPVSPTGTERILLVDDEKPIARMEKQMLQRLGYRVTERFSSSDALEAFRADPDAFDLVITDMAMPHMTGLQLAEELRAIKPTIPVIICTGFSERVNRDKARKAGIKGFLKKPVIKSDMAEMIRAVLD